MALVIPPLYAHVVHSFVWTGDSEPMAVTYGVAVGSAVTGDATDIAIEADVAFDTFMSNVSSVLTLVNTEVAFNPFPAGPAPEIGVKSNSQAGANGGAVAPQNSTFLVHKRSAVGGRSGRGRFFLPGVPEAAVDNLGNVDSTYRSSVNGSLNSLLADLVFGPLIDDMVILHDSTGAFAGATPAVVTSLQLDTRIATQRRRLRK